MIIGVDLGGTNIRIGQIERERLVAKISEPSPSDLALAPSLEYLKAAVRRMMTPEVESIGIGVPSVVDVERGVVYNVTNIPSWGEVHLKEVLEGEFGVDVYVNNDSNCFALGEKEYGRGRGFKDIVGITLGTGVGAGIVINDTLYSGRNTGAGEIGSLPYLDATLEDYCGSNFFPRFFGATGKQALVEAEKGDAGAKKIWEEFGKHIGNMMQAVLFVYDPEVIILGGGISNAYHLFEKAMREKMSGFPYPETVKNIRIEVSDDCDIQILGAAALAKNRVSTY